MEIKLFDIQNDVQKIKEHIIKKLIICCKRSIIRSRLDPENSINKQDIIKYKSVILYEEALYCFVGKNVKVSVIEYYFNRVNEIKNLQRIPVAIIGSRCRFRRAILKKLLKNFSDKGFSSSEDDLNSISS